MNAALGAALYTALVGFFLVSAGALFGRAHPLIDWLSPFALAAIAGAAAVALLAFLTARYTAGALAVAALLLNLAIVWAWVQPASAVQANGPRFKLLLFNVFYHNPRLDRAVEMIRKADADIVVLLEITSRSRPLLAELEAIYPNTIECWRQPRCDVLILSRYPLTGLANALPAARTSPSLANVSVDIEGRALSLIAAHLTLPFPFRNYADQPAQARQVAQAAAIAGPRLLVGDFNASTWGAVMGRIRDTAGLTALPGPGGSWPSFLPRQLGIPIDHVLTSPELVALSRELIAVRGSDHRAVLSEIAFKD